MNTLDLHTIDKQWTLFLDRDGVINQERPGDYVRNWNEFVFYDGVLQAMALLSEIFGRIFVVTNQRGIAKGLMTEDNLKDIHARMQKAMANASGRITRIYFSSSLDDKDPWRKPNPGMAHRAMEDFPEILMSKSLMVGNTISDMEFGKNAGMYSIFIRTTHPQIILPHDSIDLSFDSLIDFATALPKSINSKD
jgi:D-glycero-D-manno-heptose 1,7-bisphosphate phosphatase